MLLERPLSADDRRAIDNRLREIAPHLKPAADAERRQAIAQMLIGYGLARAAGDREQASVIASFVVATRSLPLYAVKRAAARFASGDVKGSEVHSNSELDLNRYPTTSQFCVVAEAACRADRDEATLASLLLRARVDEDRPLTDEEKASRAAKAKEIREGYVAEAAAEALKQAKLEREQRERAEAIMAKKRRDALIAEYEIRGLAPLFVDKDKTMVLSLSMALENGWRIEVVGGRQELTHVKGQTNA